MILMSQVLSDNLIKKFGRRRNEKLAAIGASIGTGLFLECGAGTAYRLHWW